MSILHTKLNGKKWAKIRQRVLNRDNWRCQQCGRYGNQVDHIQPLQKGGAEYDLENLQVLCRGYHIEKTRMENRRVLTLSELQWNAFVKDIL